MGDKEESKDLFQSGNVNGNPWLEKAQNRAAVVAESNRLRAKIGADAKYAD